MIATLRTQTQSIESEVEPAEVVALITDPRRIPEWAPAFADAVEGDGQAGWRASKDGRELSLHVAVSHDASTVDYLGEVAPGREGDAYLRAVPRLGGGSVIVIPCRSCQASTPLSRPRPCAPSSTRSCSWLRWDGAEPPSRSSIGLRDALLRRQRRVRPLQRALCQAWPPSDMRSRSRQRRSRCGMRCAMSSLCTGAWYQD